MTKVLDCTLDDMEFLIEKAQHFNDRYYGIPLNLDKLTQYLTGLIAADQGVVLRLKPGPSQAFTSRTLAGIGKCLLKRLGTPRAGTVYVYLLRLKIAA